MNRAFAVRASDANSINAVYSPANSVFRVGSGGISAGRPCTVAHPALDSEGAAHSRFSVVYNNLLLFFSFNIIPGPYFLASCTGYHMKALSLYLWVLLGAPLTATAAPIDRPHLYYSTSVDLHAVPGSYRYWASHGKHLSFHILCLHSSHAGNPAEGPSQNSAFDRPSWLRSEFQGGM